MRPDQGSMQPATEALVANRPEPVVGADGEVACYRCSKQARWYVTASASGGHFGPGWSLYVCDEDLTGAIPRDRKSSSRVEPVGPDRWAWEEAQPRRAGSED